MFSFSAPTNPLIERLAERQKTRPIPLEVWLKPASLKYSLRADVLTSIQAPGQQVPLAGGAFKVRRGAVYESAGLSGLSLRPSAVSKLGAHHQEALRRGLWGHQPERTDTAVGEGIIDCVLCHVTTRQQ